MVGIPLGGVGEKERAAYNLVWAVPQFVALCDSVFLI